MKDRRIRQVRLWNVLALRRFGWQYVFLMLQYMILFKVIAYAYYNQGKIIAVGGVVKIHNGVGDGFFIKTPELKNDLFLCRNIMFYVHVIVHKLKLRRLQATVDTQMYHNCRFAEYLGMSIEGKLRSYGLDGSDHYAYSRLFKSW